MIAEAIAEWLTPRAATLDPTDDFYYRPVGQPASSGVDVTIDSSLRVGTVFACIRVLGESVASLPLHVYRRLDGGGKEKAPDHPLYEVLHDRPNVWQTSFEWRESVMTHLCLRGNSYHQIIPGPQNSVGQLWPFNPDRMQVEQIDTGELRYRYTYQSGEPRSFTQDEILHLRGLSLNGITGVSVVEFARNAIGLSIAQETHGAALFKNGSMAPFYIKVPGKFDDTSRKNFRRDWRAIHAGAENAHNPPILDRDKEIKPLGITNEDSQWLESRKFQAEEIARMFRMQLHMINILDHAHYNNVEQESINFVQHCLRPWLVRFEQAFSALFMDPETHFAEFLVDGLLRGDIKTRNEAYTQGIQSGYYTRNEVRGWENLNRIEGLDEPLQPLNMAPASQADGDQADGNGGRATSTEGSRVQQIFSPLLDEAATRIAATEIRGLESRADKAAQDRERWNQWAAKFYDGHRVYIQKVLSPIAQAWRHEAGFTVDTEALAAELCRISWVIWSAGTDIPALIESWRQGHSQYIAQYLKGAWFDDV